MKKYWIVLLSLVLLAVFSIPAFAVDVKFSGEYRVRGWYDDNPTMHEKGKLSNSGAVAFYDQRLRVQTDFKIAEGLVLTTRFDALEKKWGDTSGGAGNAAPYVTGAAGGDSSGRAYTTGAKEQENIEFERAYVTFTTAIGAFQVGYMGFMAFGPDVANSSTSRPGIRYILPIGGLTIVAAIEKTGETSVGTTQGSWTDADSGAYDLGVVYKFKAGDTGIIYQNVFNNSPRALPNVAGPYKLNLNLLDAYFRGTFGPLYLEAEGLYVGGSAATLDQATAGARSIGAEEFGLFVQARLNFNPVYFGGYFGMATGDNVDSQDKKEGGWAAALKAGSDFKPCLMLFNDDYATQFANAGAQGVAGLGSYMDNIWFYQGYLGIKPTPKIDIKVSYTFAQADKDTYYTGVIRRGGKDYGQEIDVTAAFKIYDNLEYMIGGATFITGNYFQQAGSAIGTANDYLIMNKLTLTF